METLIYHSPYLGVVLCLLASGLGLPIPEDVTLLLGGYMCGTGRANIYIMLPLCYMAVLAADMMIYTIGRKYGHRVTKLPLLRRYLSDRNLARAAEFFHRHGGRTLFIARYIPGVRTPVFFTAGLFRIPAWKMLVYDGAAALISVPAIVLLAYYLSDYIHMLEDLVLHVEIGLGTLILLVLTGVLSWRLWQRKRRRTRGARRIARPKVDHAT